MEFRAAAKNPSRVEYLASVLAGIDADDPKGTAQLVLDRFGSLAAFAAADRAQLQDALAAIPALPPALAAAQEIAFAAARERVLTSRLDPHDPAFLDYLRLNIGSLQGEVLLGFFATARGALLCERTLAKSDGHSLTISAGAILRAAIAVGSTKIVLVHNHPSGLARASKADELATKELVDRGAALDIALLDHLIVGGSQVYSMQRGRVL